MSDPNFILLYVDNPLESARFYEDLLGKEPLESSPTFAMFALKSGMMLGLWSRHTVEPAVEAAKTISSDGELAFAVTSNSQVDEIYRDWSNRGMVIEQPLTRMDFGYTFVALDPDGHRLRIFAPS